MQLIARRAGDAQLAPVSLEQLWREAEALGSIDVDHELGGTAYRVRIRFANRRGSWIWATGIHTSITEALLGAIEEARRLA